MSDSYSYSFGFMANFNVLVHSQDWLTPFPAAAISIKQALINKLQALWSI